MPAPSNSKDEIITKLIQVFRQYGYDGATLALLSKATGLGRASLYHYFPHGKQEMALAALNYTNQLFKEMVLFPLQHSSGTPQEKFLEMSNNLDKFYEQGDYICLLGMLTLGDSLNLFETEIRQTFSFWIDSLAVVLESGLEPDRARRKAEDLVLQIQGALLLARGVGDIVIFKRILQQLPDSVA